MQSKDIREQYSSKISAILWSFFNRVLNVLAILGAIVLALSIIVISYDVFMRYFMNSPNNWVFEGGEYSLLFLTFLGAAWVLRDDKHIKVDIVVAKLSQKARIWVDIVASGIVVISVGFVAWAGINITWYSVEHGLFYHSILRPPKAMILGVVSLALVLILIQYLRIIYGYFKELGNRTR